MGILDFDSAAKSSNNAASGTNNRRGQAQDRPAAKLWLNVGYDANGASCRECLRIGWIFSQVFPIGDNRLLDESGF